MKYCLLFLLFLLTLLTLANSSNLEGYYGYHGYHRKPIRRGRRKWYGQRWGYRYRPPPPYVGYWYSPTYWFGWGCKKGCTSIGNGNWGCQYPGNRPSECRFAADCYGCGY